VPKAKHKRTEFIQGLSSKKTLGCLEAITQDDKNSVFVVSGRTKDLMHKWFSSISNLGLGCEYGFFYRWNSKHKTAQDFETLKKLVDWYLCFFSN
jgi:trehalose-6-phosphatase